MFWYFCLASKMKIAIIEAKHQTFFLFVWLELPILKSLEDFDRSLETFKGIFILQSFKDF